MKTKNVTHIKLDPGERCELYIRAAIGGKMQMFCSGPGTISIVRYQIAERKDDRKKQRMSEGKAVSPEGMGRARDTVPTTDDV